MEKSEERKPALGLVEIAGSECVLASLMRFLGCTDTVALVQSGVVLEQALTAPRLQPLWHDWLLGLRLPKSPLEKTLAGESFSVSPLEGQTDKSFCRASFSEAWGIDRICSGGCRSFESDRKAEEEEDGCVSALHRWSCLCQWQALTERNWKAGRCQVFEFEVCGSAVSKVESRLLCAAITGDAGPLFESNFLQKPDPSHGKLLFQTEEEMQLTPSQQFQQQQSGERTTGGESTTTLRFVESLSRPRESARLSPSLPCRPGIVLVTPTSLHVRSLSLPGAGKGASSNLNLAPGGSLEKSQSLLSPRGGPPQSECSIDLLSSLASFEMLLDSVSPPESLEDNSRRRRGRRGGGSTFKKEQSWERGRRGWTSEGLRCIPQSLASSVAASSQGSPVSLRNFLSEAESLCRPSRLSEWLGCHLDLANGLGAFAVRISRVSEEKHEELPNAEATHENVQVFDLFRRKEVAELQLAAGWSISRSRFAFSWQGDFAFAYSRAQRDFLVWSLPQGATASEVRAHREGISDLDSKNSDGLSCGASAGTPVVLTASADETLSLYSLWPLSRLMAFSGHETSVTAAAWLRRESTAFGKEDFEAPSSFAPAFVSGDEEGILLLWDARQRSATNIPGIGHSQSAVTKVRGARGGNVFVSGDADGVVKVWDVRWPAGALVSKAFRGSVVDLQTNSACCLVRLRPKRGPEFLAVLDFTPAGNEAGNAR